jgi:hypothetical protein
LCKIRSADQTPVSSTKIVSFHRPSIYRDSPSKRAIDPLTNFLSTMTISNTEEFKHSTSVIFRESSAVKQYCSQANVNNHRKLKARLKSSIESGTDLEYTASETSATVKLSEDVIFEINAFQSFKAAMQNETGPKRTHPVDIILSSPTMIHELPGRL